QPRSEGNIQRERERVAMGNAPASPMPNRKRHTIMDAAAQVSAVAAEKNDHQVTTQVRARLGPKRSPSHPPGTWNSAYEIWKAKNIQPIVTTEKPNSSWMDGAPTPITTRSM